MGLKYLLDTNILSEPTRPQPDQQVIAQLDKHRGQYGTAVTAWHEMHYGVQRMPESKRRRHYQSYLDTLEQARLPVLPYEKAAGEWLAKERGRLSQQGIAVSMADGEIAAVAVVNRLVLVTRNVDDFLGFDGLEVENWFGFPMICCNNTQMSEINMERKPTDFSKILEELRELGFNDYKMEELTGINRPNLTRLRQGKRKQPNYDDGAAIMDVYLKKAKGA